jgi:DNA recombination protein RmuC
MKETLESTLSQLGRDLREGAEQLTDEVRSRLKEVAEQMNALSDANERRQEGLRQTVETRLEKLQENNSSKLEEMRSTVDEKLHATLEKRLGDSFSLVTERLENVQTGLGEMKELAIGVGDLKRVLTDVRARGTLGEIQCGAQLDQVLSPDQYVRNAAIKEGNPEHVEFAIRIPNGEKGEMLLPVDAKFPKEEWEHLEAAMDRNSADEIAAARNDLANAVRGAAKKIAENFIDPPRTTAFALLYVPTEGLFAEVIRVPGLLDELQTQFRVSLAGPTNFIAILNSLQMGFRTVAIQRKGAEVWRILGAARIEFQKFGGLMSKVEKQVDTVQGTLKEIRGKTSAINRTLKDVNAPEMAPTEAAALLGFDEEATLPLAANQGQVLEMRGNASGDQP